MQYIAIKDLKPHPRNSEFFDDITGDKWEDFKKSIVRRGVVEGVVTSQDLTIVSGHQRVRACKELGILEVPCRVTHYPESDPQSGTKKEDMIIEDLISTNILQRGIGNVNPMKMARCIVELERIYGIKKGGDRKSNMNNSYLKTQKQLASDIGVDHTLITRYKKLTQLIPELQDMLEEGNLKFTVAYNIWAKLTLEEQERFFKQIGGKEISGMTQKQTQELLELQKQVDVLKNQLKQEKEKPVKEVMVEKEVVPEYIENELRRLENRVKVEEESKSKLQIMLGDLEEEKKKLERILNSDEYNIDQKKKKEASLRSEAHISMFDLQIKVQKFIKEASPSIYLQGAMAYADKTVRKEMMETVKALEKYTDNLKDMLQGEISSMDETKNVIEYIGE
ncbi:ParB/RepB/Spo0J family partition protein [Bacillus sp. AG4(2022)]|uniref:ParB/RepB/Spo0J family partition protein n=1 Tax=Bacillus sp. AG4(2022) TaxID=2962594 RepID=UPI0028829BBD|nr:ParB/RepB/Spo0J family partition protein [Bacillus sp. AG4(2022)]MDT0160305.1 ParB/RepB/Spo0J family partition protein [Bacillus sp. AG4(2022)]